MKRARTIGNDARFASLAACLAVFCGSLFAGEPQGGLPDLKTFKEMLGEQPAPGPVQGQAVESSPSSEAPCPAFSAPLEAVIQARMWSWNTVYDIRSAGQALGTIEAVKGGYVWRDASGAAVAAASETKAKTARLITVVNCSGTKIGEISESDAPRGGNKSFELRDAQGLAVANSGTVAFLQSKIVLSGRQAAEFESNHWFLDRWAIRVPAEGVDPRLVAMVLSYNSKADSRESTLRRRHRRGHRRHGSHAI